MNESTTPLNVYVLPSDGEIVEVGPHRHRVIWAGSKTPSIIDYCNNCGSPFVFGSDKDDLHDFCACGAPA